VVKSSCHHIPPFNARIGQHFKNDGEQSGDRTESDQQVYDISDEHRTAREQFHQLISQQVKHRVNDQRYQHDKAQAHYHGETQQAVEHQFEPAFFWFGFEAPDIIDRILDLCKYPGGSKDQRGDTNNGCPGKLPGYRSIMNDLLYLRCSIGADKAPDMIEDRYPDIALFVKKIDQTDDDDQHGRNREHGIIRQGRTHAEGPVPAEISTGSLENGPGADNMPSHTARVKKIMPLSQLFILAVPVIIAGIFLLKIGFQRLCKVCTGLIGKA
jgi:hypothetical protein